MYIVCVVCYIISCFRGMDPLAFAVLCGISSGVAGFLLGGATFNATWKIMFKQRYHKLQEVSPFGM